MDTMATDEALFNRWKHDQEHGGPLAGTPAPVGAIPFFPIRLAEFFRRDEGCGVLRELRNSGMTVKRMNE